MWCPLPLPLVPCPRSWSRSCLFHLLGWEFLAQAVQARCYKSGSMWPMFGIGNQVAVFKKFALLAKDRIGHFAEPCHQESSCGQFGCWNLEHQLGDVNACKHCLLHDTGCPWPGVVPVLWFIILVLQDVVRPCNGRPMFPMSRGHIFNNLQLGSGFNNLHWLNSNSWHHPHNLHSATNC